MKENKEALKGLNILCIGEPVLVKADEGTLSAYLLDSDGGGIGGLSSLFLLAEIMKGLQELEGQHMPLKPADYFDVIAGTGAGGVSACMVGRLGMSTDEAIKAFIKLANDGFSRKYVGMSGGTAYKGTVLQDALRSMVQDAIGDQNAAMQNDNSNGNICKTIVFAMSKHHIDPSVPILFRSYSTRSTDTQSYSIWEALYATMAHPDLFKAIDIVYDSISQPFICAELGCGNPIAHVLAEVRSLYPDRQVSSVLSIGSGRARITQISEPNMLERVRGTWNQTATAVANMATESEDVNEQMAMRFQNTTEFYYRFNVDQGLQTMKYDWKRQSEVKAHTTAYMKKIEVGRRISQAIQSVKVRANVLPVKYIDGTIQTSGLEPTIDIKDCPAPNPVFTSREDLVRQVGDCIAGDVNGRRVCVLHGMGGAGKTQIALKAIQLNRETWEHVLYVDASSKRAVEGPLGDFAKAKGLGKTFKDAINWLASCHKPWLLVFDNADHPSLDIHDYFPHGDCGSILITTRRPALGVHAHGHGSTCHVSEMNKEDAVTLFFKAARIQVSAIDADEMEAAHALLKEFGYLALAIVHAGAYIAYSPDISIAQYLQLFLERRQRMLEQYIELGPLVKLDNYERSVYTTFKLCCDSLQESGDARPTLWLISYLHHDDIRQEIFRRAAMNVGSYRPCLRQTVTEQEALKYMQVYLGRFLDSDGNWNSTRFSNAMNELASYSLVEFDRVNQAYRVHILVQDWARTSNPQEQELAVECCTLLLSLSVDYLNTIESLAFTRSLRRHLEEVLPKQTGQLSANHAWGFGWACAENGSWEQAEELRAHLAGALKDELGEEHPDTLAGMSNLANTYQSRGELVKAQSLQEQVLNARKRLLGEEHPDTLTSMSNLAITYRSRGEWDKAQSLQEQVLNARKRVHGEEHPDTLTSMSNLANTYHSRGEWEKAQSLREQVLNAFKRLLGEEHPDTLSSMNNFANTYHSRDEWHKAQSLQEQVLNVQKQVLGEEHPHTLTSMNNLAITYHSRGEWDKARSLKEQVLNARKRVLGEEHPDTLTSRSNLATTYESQGEWDKAQSLQEQVLNARKRVLGEEHPHTLKSMSNLAMTYQSRGEWDKAQSLQEQVLNAQKRVLGEEHPDTLKSMNSLSFIYAKLRRFGESEQLAAAVDALKNIVGEQHEIAVWARNHLDWLRSREVSTASSGS